MTHKEIWLKNYKLARKYYEENGDLLMLSRYETKNEEGDIVKLGLWIMSQRQAYKNGRLEDWKIKLLDEIEMVWVIENRLETIQKNDDKRWLDNYHLARKYYEENGDLLMLSRYETKNEAGNIVKLGFWIRTQRYAYKNGKLEDWKIKLLDEIEMVWVIENRLETIQKNNDKRWLKKYNLAKIYYEENGDLLIPSTYETKDEEGNVIKLGVWINRQRKFYKNNNLENWKIKLLEEIEMVWAIENKYEIVQKNNDKRWLKKYNIAKSYYEENGDLLIPYKHEMKDEEGNVIKLGTWIMSQRQAYKNGRLEDWKIKLLDEIEIVIPKKYDINMINDSTWKEYYLMLRDYKYMYGDTFVLESYVYKNGNNDLHNWLEKQKECLDENKDKDKILLLNDIDSNWKNTNVSYLEKYIEEEYSLYLHGLLDDKNVDKLLNTGVFIYTDNKTIEKASSNEFLTKIKSR